MDTSSFLIRLEAAKKEREVSNSGVPCELNAAYRLLADWWDSLSPKQQKRYLELHPRSRKHKLRKSLQNKSQKLQSTRKRLSPSRSLRLKTRQRPQRQNSLNRQSPRVSQASRSP
jgi:hypothetical protein